MKKKYLFYIIGPVMIGAVFLGGYSFFVSASFNAVEEAISVGDGATAQDKLTLLSLVRPSHPRVLYYEGYLAFQQASTDPSLYQMVLDKSFRSLKEGLEENNPELYRPLMKRIADTLVQMKRFSEAEEYYREFNSAIGPLGGDDPALRIAGLYYYYLAETEGAHAILGTLSRKNFSSRDILAYHKVAGETAYIKGDFRKAEEEALAVIDFFERDGGGIDLALENKSNLEAYADAEAYRVLALSYAALGEKKAAEDSLSELEYLSRPKNGYLPFVRVTALCGLVRAHMALENVDEVITLTSQIEPFGVESGGTLAAQPELNCIYARILAEQKLGNMSEARKFAEQYLSILDLSKSSEALLSRDREEIVQLINEQ